MNKMILLILMLISMPQFSYSSQEKNDRAMFESNHRVLVSCVMMYAAEHGGDLSQFTPFTPPKNAGDIDNSIKQYLTDQTWDMFYGSQTDPDKAEPKYAEYRIANYTGVVDSVWKSGNTENESEWVELNFTP